jgi:hypothetical protein
MDRCLVIRITITCESCGLAWTVAGGFSVYEQQAVESSPCPHCGAYTLCCHRPDEAPNAPEPHPIPARP